MTVPTPPPPPTPSGAGPEAPWPPPGEVSKEEGSMALLAFVFSCLFPILTLIIFLVRKGQSRFVAFHSLQAIFLILSLLATYVIVGLAIGGIGGKLELAEMLCFVAWVGSLVIAIRWGIKANRGEWRLLPVIGQWAKRWA
jgi:uncharacterized membrane protein